MTCIALPSPLPLPAGIRHRIDAKTRALFGEAMSDDFLQPRGAYALAAPNSVSWRIFKNPVSLFIGGVAAVIMELAEPGVRSGVWEHSGFRTDPARRLQRTGYAAMLTIYGPADKARAMIGHVRQVHERVAGETPSGTTYRANDPILLNWVQATAGYGFAEAYNRFVDPLSPSDLDRLYAEGAPIAALYGAAGPESAKAMEVLFQEMRPRLEHSQIVFEFLTIMRDTPVFAGAPKPLRHLLVRAAVEVTPPWIRAHLGLESERLRWWERPVVRWIGALADRIVLRESPAVKACLRLGLPADYLYRRQSPCR